jgi:hypothetical protein
VSRCLRWAVGCVRRKRTPVISELPRTAQAQMWRDKVEFSLILGSGRGWQIELLDVGQPLIAAMVSFFASFVSPSAPPVDATALEAAAHAWFDGVAGDHDAEDAYFVNFAGMWLQLWGAGLRSFAAEVWPYSLKAVFSWEAAHPGRRIHKGSPYYYWGGSLIAQGDLDIGFMLIHQALREDTLSAGHLRRDMPAWKFCTLDPDPAQFMKPVVDQITDFMTALCRVPFFPIGADSTVAARFDLCGVAQGFGASDLLHGRRDLPPASLPCHAIGTSGATTVDPSGPEPSSG